MKKIYTLIMLFATVFAAGTTLTLNAQDVVAPISIDEKHIVNKTGTNANFAPLLDMIKTEFFQAGYELVDMNDLAEAIKHAETVAAVNGTGSTDAQLEFAGYIVRISVLKYGFYEIDNRRNYNSRARKGVNRRAAAEVSISIHVVKMTGKKAGRTVASCIVSSPKKTVQLDEDMLSGRRGESAVKEPLLQECNMFVAKTVVKELEKCIPMKFRPKPLLVYQAKGDRVILRSTGRRLAENTVLDVFATEIIGEGEDQEVIPGDLTGRIMVERSTDKYIICRLLTSGAAIKKNMVATPVASNAAPAHPAPPVRQDNAPF